MLVLAKPKLIARLLASDFPSENTPTQTRNFPYTERCTQAKIELEINKENLKKVISNFKIESE